MKICTIVGAGEFFGIPLSSARENLIIAADGGLIHLKKLGIKPDLLVGDFDSLSFKPAENTPFEVIMLEKEKDDTDTAYAVKAGLERGCTEFHFYGCTEGRFDHTVANIQLLVHLSKRGAQGFLHGKNETVTAITDSKIEFGSEMKGYVSVFCIGGQADGVVIKGLKYKLENAQLTNDFPLGISNEFTGVKSFVSVNNGTLLIVVTNQI